MVAVPLRMPKMSMTMTEGELSRWLVAPGDLVREGQTLCEVLTDKVDMEVESPATGTVTSLECAEGAVLAVGTPIAWIDSATAGLLDDILAEPGASEAPVGEPLPEAPAGPPTPIPSSAPAPPATTTGVPAQSPAAVAAPSSAPASAAPAQARPKAIPGARREAARRGLDLASLTGSGPGGAVMWRDLPAEAPAGGPTAHAGPVPALAGDPTGSWAPYPSPEGSFDQGYPPEPWRGGHRGPSRRLVQAEVELDLGAEPTTWRRALTVTLTALASIETTPGVELLLPGPDGLVRLSRTGERGEDARAEWEPLARTYDYGSVPLGYLAVVHRPGVRIWVSDSVDRWAVPAPGALGIGIGRVSARPAVRGEGLAVRWNATITLSSDGGDAALVDALARAVQSVTADTNWWL